MLYLRRFQLVVTLYLIRNNIQLALSPKTKATVLKIEAEVLRSETDQFGM
jgi:hypothetical protein